MAKRNTFEPVAIRVESGPEAARTALAQLFTALSDLDLSAETSGRIELVLAEILNNIVEHAYADNQLPHPIDLHCRADGLLLRFETIDRGLPMPDGQLPDGAAADLDVDLPDLPEGGFGWFLIRDLTEEIAYHRRGAENVLNFSIIRAPDDAT